MYDVYNVSYGYLFYFACMTLSEETRSDGEKKKEGYSGWSDHTIYVDNLCLRQKTDHQDGENFTVNNKDA